MESKQPPKEPCSGAGDSDGLEPREPPKKLCYGVKELARALGVSRGFIYKEIAAGRLRPIKLGRRTSFTVEEVRRYLADCPRGPKSDSALSWSVSGHGYPWAFTGIGLNLRQHRSYRRPLMIAVAAALAASIACFGYFEGPQLLSAAGTPIASAAPSQPL
jgi:excisionase family DNA binding protein